MSPLYLVTCASFDHNDEYFVHEEGVQVSKLFREHRDAEDHRKELDRQHLLEVLGDGFQEWYYDEGLEGLLSTTEKDYTTVVEKLYKLLTTAKERKEAKCETAKERVNYLNQRARFPKKVASKLTEEDMDWMCDVLGLRIAVIQEIEVQ